MRTNLILDELHATRAKLLAEAEGDLHRYIEEARKRALASGRPIAKLTLRKSRSVTALNLGVSATESQSPPPGDR